MDMFSVYEDVIHRVRCREAQEATALYPSLKALFDDDDALVAEYEELGSSLTECDECRPFAEGAGYHTHFGGLYVCYTCGHLCECGDDE